MGGDIPLPEWKVLVRKGELWMLMKLPNCFTRLECYFMFLTGANRTWRSGMETAIDMYSGPCTALLRHSPIHGGRVGYMSSRLPASFA